MFSFDQYVLEVATQREVRDGNGFIVDVVEQALTNREQTAENVDAFFASQSNMTLDTLLNHEYTIDAFEKLLKVVMDEGRPEDDIVEFEWDPAMLVEQAHSLKGFFGEKWEDHGYLVAQAFLHLAVAQNGGLVPTDRQSEMDIVNSAYGLYQGDITVADPEAV